MLNCQDAVHSANARHTKRGRSVSLRLTYVRLYKNKVFEFNDILKRWN